MFYSAAKKRGIDRHASADRAATVRHAGPHCSAAGLQDATHTAQRESERESTASRMNPKCPD